MGMTSIREIRDADEDDYPSLNKRSVVVKLEFEEDEDTVVLREAMLLGRQFILLDRSAASKLPLRGSLDGYVALVVTKKACER